MGEAIKYVRGEEVKYTGEQFEAQLSAIGFIRADKPIGDADKDELMAEAKALGLEPHHRAGVEKLKEMIAEAKANKE